MSPLRELLERAASLGARVGCLPIKTSATLQLRCERLDKLPFVFRNIEIPRCYGPTMRIFADSAVTNITPGNIFVLLFKIDAIGEHSFAPREFAGSGPGKPSAFSIGMRRAFSEAISRSTVHTATFTAWSAKLP